MPAISVRIFTQSILKNQSLLKMAKLLLFLEVLPSMVKKSSSMRCQKLLISPGEKIGVDVVLECTGFYTTKDKALDHVKAGARKVVISPAGKDLPTTLNEKLN